MLPQISRKNSPYEAIETKEYKMKNTRKKQQSQQTNNPLNSFVVKNISNLSSEIPYWNKSKRLLFDMLINYSIEYEVVYPSQTTLGNKLGITRQHCCRLIAELKSVGLVSSYQSSYNTSCTYEINPVVFMAPFIDKISFLFKSLRKLTLYLPLSLLGILNLNVTLLTKELDNKKESYIIAPSYSRRVMKQAMEKIVGRGPIHELIDKLPFKLDINQKVFLCSFPYAAIEYAQDKILLATNPKYPWRYFLVMLYEYCSTHAVERDMEYYYYLRKGYHFSEQPNTEHADFLPEKGKERLDILLRVVTAPLENATEPLTKNKQLPKQENLNPSSLSISDQIRKMPQPSKPSSVPKQQESLPIMKPYIKPLLEDYADWLSFLDTEKGKSANAAYKAIFGTDIPYQRQGDLDDYNKSNPLYGNNNSFGNRS